MQIKHFLTVFFTTSSELFGRWFHKRNIIIVSEHKVKHIPISGALQFIALTAVISGICWASYSTGGYMSAQLTMREQSKTIRSVVGNKVESSFSVMQQPVSPTIGDKDAMAALAGPKMALTNALSGASNVDLYARIAKLEQKLAESERNKNDFVDQVKKRTTLSISTLESAIEQTGLNLKSLKKQAPDGDDKDEESENADSKDFESQGGPYVPTSSLPESPKETEVISSLDQLSALKQIVDNLPVSKPIKNYQQMSAFGHRIDPFRGTLAFHSGLDMAGPTGSKIYSTADGKITFAGRGAAYGNMIDIDHGHGISTRYAHLSEILVQEGTPVKRGQVIGIQGSTGRSTGAHLHYEVRYNDQPMNPKNFLLAGRYVPQN